MIPLSPLQPSGAPEGRCKQGPTILHCQTLLFEIDKIDESDADNSIWIYWKQKSCKQHSFTRFQLVFTALMIIFGLFFVIIFNSYLLGMTRMQSGFIIGNKQGVFVFHPRPAKPPFCHFVLT